MSFSRSTLINIPFITIERSTEYDIPGTPAKIDFDDTPLIDGSQDVMTWSSANNRITFNEDGNILVFCTGNMYNPNKQRIRPYINGSLVEGDGQQTPNSGANEVSQFRVAYDITNGDYLEFWGDGAGPTAYIIDIRWTTLFFRSKEVGPVILGNRTATSFHKIPFVFAYLTSSDTITSTPTIINWDTVVTRWPDVSESAGVFTINKKCCVLVQIHYSLTSSTSTDADPLIAIRKNSTTVHSFYDFHGGTTDGQDVAHSFQHIVECSSGDTIDIQVSDASSGSSQLRSGATNVTLLYLGNK